MWKDSSNPTTSDIRDKPKVVKPASGSILSSFLSSLTKDIEIPSSGQTSNHAVAGKPPFERINRQSFDDDSFNRPQNIAPQRRVSYPSGNNDLKGSSQSGNSDFKGSYPSGNNDIKGSSQSGNSDFKGSYPSGNNDLKGSSQSGNIDFKGSFPSGNRENSYPSGNNDFQSSFPSRHRKQSFPSGNNDFQGSHPSGNRENSYPSRENDFQGGNRENSFPSGNRESSYPSGRNMRGSFPQQSRGRGRDSSPRQKANNYRGPPTTTELVPGLQNRYPPRKYKPPGAPPGGPPQIPMLPEEIARREEMSRRRYKMLLQEEEKVLKKFKRFEDIPLAGKRSEELELLSWGMQDVNSPESLKSLTLAAAEVSDTDNVETLQCRVCRVFKFKSIDHYQKHMNGELHILIAKELYRKNNIHDKLRMMQAKLTQMQTFIKEQAKDPDAAQTFDLDQELEENHSEDLKLRCCGEMFDTCNELEIHSIEEGHPMDGTQEKIEGQPPVNDNSSRDILKNEAVEEARKKREENPLTMGNIPPYDPMSLFGMEFLVYREHYRCGACMKHAFLDNESFVEHCKSEKHYESVKRATALNEKNALMLKKRVTGLVNREDEHHIAKVKQPKKGKISEEPDEDMEDILDLGLSETDNLDMDEEDTKPEESKDNDTEGKEVNRNIMTEQECEQALKVIIEYHWRDFGEEFKNNVWDKKKKKEKKEVPDNNEPLSDADRERLMKRLYNSEQLLKSRKYLECETDL